MLKQGEADTDPVDLAAIVEDIRRGVQFIRAAEGYGEVTVTLQVRPAGFAGWDMATKISRKPRRGDQSPGPGKR